MRSRFDRPICTAFSPTFSSLPVASATNFTPKAGRAFAFWFSLFTFVFSPRTLWAWFPPGTTAVALPDIWRRPWYFRAQGWQKKLASGMSRSARAGGSTGRPHHHADGITVCFLFFFFSLLLYCIIIHILCCIITSIFSRFAIFIVVRFVFHRCFQWTNKVF